MIKTLFDDIAPPEPYHVAPCPFCGAQGISVERDEDVAPGDALHWLECGNCGACGPVCSTAQQSQHEWTERYSLECTRFEVNRLSQELHRVTSAFDAYRIRVNSRDHDRRHAREKGEKVRKPKAPPRAAPSTGPS